MLWQGHRVLYKNVVFRLAEDSKFSEDKRWVIVAPSGTQECWYCLPKEEEYGLVAVSAYLYGDLWDLRQPNENNMSTTLQHSFLKMFPFGTCHCRALNQAAGRYCRFVLQL